MITCTTDVDIRSARWDITSNCNLNCIHCSARGLLKGTRDLSKRDAIHLLDILHENGLKDLNILGGEPFTYPYIYNVLSYACNLGFNVDITTNGTLVSDSNANDLIDLGLRSIFFSIDGSMPSINDVIRGSGVFDKAVRAVSRFSKLKETTGSSTDIIVNTVLNKINSSNIPQIIELCDRLNVEGFRLFDLDLLGNALSNSNMLFLNREEKLQAFKGIAQVIPDYPNLSFDILSSNPKFLEFLYEKYKLVFPVTIAGCKACKKEIYIDPMGNFSPCISARNYQDPISHNNYTGSIFNLKGAPMLEQEIFRAFMDNFPLAKDTYSNYIPCIACPYLTTLCYPCPLGSSSDKCRIELCSLAEEELTNREKC